MAQYDKKAVLEQHFAQMSLFNQATIDAVPECEELKKSHDVIQAIFHSQATCTAGTINFGLFTVNPCFYQHSEENRRKVSVPTVGLEFASVFILQPERERTYKSEYSSYRTLILKPACKRKTIYDHDY